MSAAPSTVTTTTLKGIDPNMLTAPNATSGTNSILAACGDLSTTDAFAYVIKRRQIYTQISWGFRCVV